MAIHKFIIKPGKGVRTITAEDIELLEKDFTDDIQIQRRNLQNISNEFRDKLDNNRVITSNLRQTTYNPNVAKNDDTYLLTYSADNQNIEFIASSGFPVLGTVRRLVVKLETENTLEFKGQFSSQEIIAPKGKLTTSTGRGNVIEVYLVRRQNSTNVIFLTGDLDEELEEPINIPEYTIDVIANELKLYKDGVESFSKDLSLYIDDTNLSRLVGGVLDDTTGIVTFTRDDNSSFSVDFSVLLGGVTPTGLEAIDEGNGVGWRLAGRNTRNYGNIGLSAIDFSNSTSSSNIKGATGEASFALGTNVNASGITAIGIGTNAEGSGNESIVIGNNAFSDQSAGIAIGRSSRAEGLYSAAFGPSSRTRGQFATALGTGATNFGDSAISIGNDSHVTIDASEGFGISMGFKSRTHAQSGISIGFEAFVNKGALKGIAIGANANAAGPSSVALQQNVAYSFAEIAMGINSIGYSPNNISGFDPLDRLLNIGNGATNSLADSSNAFTILKNGTITAPSLTNELINTAGPKALITKEYADANYSGGTNVGFGTLQTLDISFRDADLLFDDTKPLTELIPAIENHLIVIDRIAILGSITKGVEQSYANVFIAYNKLGYNSELIEVRTNEGKQLQTDSTSWDIDNNLLNLEQSPVSAAIVLKGPDGIGTTGLEGIVNIKIVYSYLDVTPILQGR